MKVTEICIYGLPESIVASGLPMVSYYDNEKFDRDTKQLQSDRLYNDIEVNKHFNRACTLADTASGSGHQTFLSGIVVQMNISATVKWWEQWQRYHFQQIVSSMSTMHRLRKMVIEDTIKFNELTNPDMVSNFKRLAKDENVTDEELAYSCPMGIELTARVTTNYLQLKTIKIQRKTHKLTEWRDFVSVIDSLPFAKEFIG